LGKSSVVAGNAFCRALPATIHVVQWGGPHMWKVGGKVFATGGWQDDEPSFTFRVSDIAQEMLKEQPGLRPRQRIFIPRVRLSSM
jgi:predicted DNA-binding protein (MmcQ/YjbR family)